MKIFNVFKRNLNKEFVKYMIFSFILFNFIIAILGVLYNFNSVSMSATMIACTPVFIFWFLYAIDMCNPYDNSVNTNEKENSDV